MIADHNSQKSLTAERIHRSETKGSFPHNKAVYKALYLNITELEKKWENRTIPNWAQVRNQLLCEEGIESRLERYGAK